MKAAETAGGYQLNGIKGVSGISGISGINQMNGINPDALPRRGV